MKLQTLQAELNRLDRRRHTLERRIEVRAAKAYRELPRRVGLKRIDDLVIKLLPFSSPELRKKLNGAVSGRAATPHAASPGSRGNRYPPEVKAAVLKEVKAGGKTAAELSRQYGPSVFLIKSWKRTAGLTRRYKKGKAAAKHAAK